MYFVLDKVFNWIETLLKEKVDVLILHPVFELHFLGKLPILPLYTNLVKETFKYSIVWKIWLIWNSLDLYNIDFSSIIKSYQLTDRQKKIKKFKKWFVFYKKEVPLWKYYLLQLNKRNWMIRKTIKFDIRYFFDCHVDSLLPTSWWIYAFDKIIYTKKKKLLYKRLKDIENINRYLLEKNQETYKVDIIDNWNVDFFLREKKWRWLIFRWEL